MVSNYTWTCLTRAFFILFFFQVEFFSLFKEAGVRTVVVSFTMENAMMTVKLSFE